MDKRRACCNRPTCSVVRAQQEQQQQLPPDTQMSAELLYAGQNFKETPSEYEEVFYDCISSDSDIPKEGKGLNAQQLNDIKRVVKNLEDPKNMRNALTQLADMSKNLLQHYEDNNRSDQRQRNAYGDSDTSFAPYGGRATPSAHGHSRPSMIPITARFDPHSGFMEPIIIPLSLQLLPRQPGRFGQGGGGPMYPNQNQYYPNQGPPNQMLPRCQKMPQGQGYPVGALRGPDFEQYPTTSESTVGPSTRIVASVEVISMAIQPLPPTEDDSQTSPRVAKSVTLLDPNSQSSPSSATIPGTHIESESGQMEPIRTAIIASPHPAATDQLSVMQSSDATSDSARTGDDGTKKQAKASQTSLLSETSQELYWAGQPQCSCSDSQIVPSPSPDECLQCSCSDSCLPQPDSSLGLPVVPAKPPPKMFKLAYPQHKDIDICVKCRFDPSPLIGEDGRVFCPGNCGCCLCPWRPRSTVSAENSLIHTKLKICRCRERITLFTPAEDPLQGKCSVTSFFDICPCREKAEAVFLQLYGQEMWEPQSALTDLQSRTVHLGEVQEIRKLPPNKQVP